MHDLNNLRAPEEISTRLVSPVSYNNPDQVHRDLSWLRMNAPISLINAPNIDPFWCVSRHSDILEIERRPDVFRNGDRSTVLIARPMIDAVMGLTGSPHLVRSMVNMDGGEHRQFRSLAQPWFTPANVRKLTETIRAIARTHVDRMIARDGECDFVADVALHYPLHVIMSILGVPEADEGRMLTLTQQLFGARDPELSRKSEAMSDPATAIGIFQSVLGDFYGYFSEISSARREEPTGDFATVIANAVIGGRPITDREANDMYILVATAGHDTTSASTSGAMWALAQRPHLLDQIKERPSLIPALVEEAIRWVTPVKHFMRTAAADCEINGHQFRSGDWIMLSYMSANRDESVFSDPFEFRVDRSSNQQVAFGYGPHVCVGQHLAKLEMTILFEELLPRIRTLELNGEGAWTQSNFVSGPKRLPIRFSPA